MKILICFKCEQKTTGRSGILSVRVDGICDVCFGKEKVGEINNYDAIMTREPVDEYLYKNKYLSVRKCHDKEYYYAERLGVDSIAFVLYRMGKNGDEYGLIREYKPPVHDFVISAFGGSIDKDMPLVDIVIEEVKEESGYTVTADNITYCGKRLVSTQMNQYCHLYFVMVDGLEEGEKEPENYLESIATVVWLPLKDIQAHEFLDWKAQVIVNSSIKIG